LLSFVFRVPCTYAAFENNLENNKEVWRVSQTDKTLEMLSLRPGKCERKNRDISSVKNNEGSDRIVPQFIHRKQRFLLMMCIARNKQQE